MLGTVKCCDNVHNGSGLCKTSVFGRVVLGYLNQGRLGLNSNTLKNFGNITSHGQELLKYMYM
jgi:hypothetical protein